MIDGASQQHLDRSSDKHEASSLDGGKLMSQPEAHSGARNALEHSRSDSQALTRAGTLPALELEGVRHGDSVGDKITDLLASKQDQEIFSDFDRLASRCGQKPLSPAQKFEIENLPADMKQMYKKTIQELTDLKDGKMSPADYFTHTLKNAAELAKENGRQPGSWNILKESQGALFRDYVGLVLSEKPLGFARDVGREVVGGGPDIAGSALEGVYQSIVANGTAAEGFNPNVADVDPTNSITHHFREFMMVGYNRWQFVGDKAATFIDKPDKNPGDVRNGFFGTMIGSALRTGDISPSEAADLTSWAYTKHGGTQPPWGNINRAGNYLDPSKDYNINDWLKAFRNRHP